MICLACDERIATRKGKCRRCYDGPEKTAARRLAAKVRDGTGRESLRAKLARLERENSEMLHALGLVSWAGPGRATGAPPRDAGVRPSIQPARNQERA